jgi:sucrose phosphorylase
MRPKVELIAYADRFGTGLAGLRGLLNGPLRGLFGGVHVLPFYRPYDGADAGFDPQDHTEVDERLGSWADISALGGEYRVMADMIVNHVSSGSAPFQDWLARGEESQFAGMFLTYGTVFPGGATEEELLRLYRPRPGLPFTPYRLAGGRRTLVWTTFTPQQVDVDVRHPVTRAYLLRVLDRLAAAGVSHVRLDAVGYAVKTPGLSSFMTPETFKFIGELTAWCHDRGLEVLVEVHSYYLHQVEIARQVDYVYDFALPPLILHALTAADARPLLAWQGLRPANAVTVLDTHDGIGVIDVGPDAGRGRPGLLSPDQLNRLVEAIHAGSGETSRRATGAAASNVDLYQVNCLLRRTGPRRRPLPARPGAAVLDAGDPAGLLRRPARGEQRHGPAGPHPGRPRRQPALLHARRDRRQPGQAGGAGAGPADPVPERAPCLRGQHDLFGTGAWHRHELGPRRR